MTNIEKTIKLLRSLQVPAQQQSELCALTLLAMAGLKPSDSFGKATCEWIRIHDITAFIAKYYHKTYAENSRETIRKQAIHHFRNAAFVEDNGRPTNSPDFRCRLTAEFVTMMQANNSAAVRGFLSVHESLVKKYESKKAITRVPVTVNGQTYTLSAGSHNWLQKAIVEEFGSRFAPGAECLYLGDTIKKDLVKNEAALHALGFDITLHDKMPDVVLYSAKRQWLFLVEAVTSVGPMSPKRILELKKMTEAVVCGVIYVTAFPDRATFKRFVTELAWDTEAWIADAPDHMIHLNGDRFLGPH